MPNSEDSSVATIHPVTDEQHPRRGRPQKVINKAYLQEVAHPSRGISKKKLAGVLGIHRNTLKKKLDESGIRFKYSLIENADLDALIKAYKAKNPV